MRLILLSVVLDAATTLVGLRIGLEEKGPIAKTLIPLIGPLYFLIEALALTGIYLLVKGILERTGHQGIACPAVAAVPWLVAWHNLGLLLRTVA